MICSANGLPCFKDLIAVLFECFSIISLGYLSCRFKLVSSQAKDLNSYLTNFALPMIIFLNIAQMEFRTINLSFLLCALAAKLLVFLTVTLLTLTISYPTNFGYAGSLSILATQSNDFALGYPLIKLLYGESRPEMLNYLSLMAPIQLLILNPLGIAMLEYQKSKNHRKRSHLKNHDDNNSDSYNNSDNNNHSVRNVKNVSREEDALVVPSGATEEAISESFPHKFEESCSPTRLLEVADLLISDRSKSCSSHEPPQSINSGIGVSEIASRFREPIADDERRRLKCRQKNARSLALAMPVRDMPSPTVQQRSSSNELQRSYSGESSVGAKISPESRFISVDGQRNELSPKTGTPTRESVPYDVTDNRTPSDRRTSMVGVETGYKSKLDLGFFKALATNPLILASIIALFVNLTHGPELPKYITRVSNTIAASFAAPALFVVGLSMYGKFELLLRNPRDLLLSSVMVLTKGLLLPCLLRTIALLVMPNFASSEDVPYLVDFAFLYGLLPTAPTACIIAKQYGVLQNVVSISMLLSTIIAGPMTLASSVIINPSSVISVRDLENVITQTMETSSVLTLILAPFTLIAFLKLRNSSLTYRNILHASRHAALNGMKRLLRGNPVRVFVFLLILSQIMIGIGGFLWFFIDTSELSDSPHHPSVQLESRTTTTTTENIGLHNIIDPLEEPSDEFIVPTIATTSETQALHSGRMLLNQRRPWLSDHQLDLGFRTLSLIRYVFSAGGLMMAQFCTLSLVSVIAATKSRGYAAGQRVSELLLKACLTVLVCIVVWLVYDSEQLVHLPVEASLPSSTQSLCVRLLYNVTILAICLPLYALMIRTDNRIREADKKESTKNIAVSALRSSLEPDLQVNTFVKRRFVTSSASLSSEASSAATSNTNLDLTLSSGPYVAVSLDGSASPHAQLMTSAATPDSMSIILDTKSQEKPIGPVESLALNPDTHIFRPGYESSLPLSPAPNDTDRLKIKNQIDVQVDNNNNEITPTDREKGCNVSGQNHHHHHHHHHNFTRLGEHEFNQYSILIVFMLINSTLNLFSVAQKLLHEEPAGTFRQIEIIGMAFEFGQGLLMFIVYGTEGLVDQLLCRRAPS